jgi:hypothetical protein
MVSQTSDTKLKFEKAYVSQVLQMAKVIINACNGVQGIKIIEYGTSRAAADLKVKIWARAGMM